MDDDRLREDLRLVDSVGEPDDSFLERLYVAAANDLAFENRPATPVERVTSRRHRTGRTVARRPASTLSVLARVAAVLAVSLIGIAVIGTRFGVEVGPSVSASPSAVASGSTAPSPSARDWWRTGVSGTAAGPLSAGIHTSTSFQPQVTYTVPPGWVNNYDRADGLQLMPDTPDNRSAVQAGGATYRYVTVLRNERLAAKDCSNNPEPGAGFAAKGLVSALAKRAGLQASVPTPIRVGGLSGWQVDLAVSSTWTTPCPESNGAPAVPTVQNGEAHWWLVQADRTRYIVLDDPQGGNVFIEITAAPAGTFDSHLAASLPIVESFVFDLVPRGPTSSASAGP